MKNMNFYYEDDIQVIKESAWCRSVKRHSQRKIEVEIFGEPRIRKTCLSPRSTPIVLEINFCPIKYNSGETNLSKSMKVEWESTHDEVVSNKFTYQRNQYNGLNICEHEISVAYLGRQNKRVYLDGDDLVYMRKNNHYNEFDSTKVNLSKRSKLEDNNLRHLNLCDKSNNKASKNQQCDDFVLTEEWLFEK
ncbi:hypothetical protein OJ253_2167 [Cryptosporidium canis]|uniref:Uncharacterized protein n=1 Tax=Cryptosporidium canis TaxID=195482 RepID=A0A9D5DG61_9CRYT|nr:hypothetical protein OJ253_2167 [Cryptosporidium canis]